MGLKDSYVDRWREGAYARGTDGLTAETYSADNRAASDLTLKFALTCSAPALALIAAAAGSAKTLFTAFAMAPALFDGMTSPN